MVSIIILTKNEEQDLNKCLSSLQWCNDIYVLDSGSTDSTIEIAKANGANVFFHPFESFGKQRNFALDALDVKNEWILFLDADEKVTEGFKSAVLNAIEKAGPEIAGFYCCWKMMLEDKWLRYSDNFPKWQFRVLRKGRARFKDFGHGQKEDKINGIINYIREPYLHYGFSKGWYHWIVRHNRYSSNEATARMNDKQPFKNVFSKHGSIRNSALKLWLVGIPGWPLWRFFYGYIFNLGFLEGPQGFIYCVNIAYYEFLIKIKMREIRNQNKLKNLK